MTNCPFHTSLYLECGDHALQVNAQASQFSSRSRGLLSSRVRPFGHVPYADNAAINLHRNRALLFYGSCDLIVELRDIRNGSVDIVQCRLSF